MSNEDQGRRVGLKQKRLTKRPPQGVAFCSAATVPFMANRYQLVSGRYDEPLVLEVFAEHTSIPIVDDERLGLP